MGVDGWINALGVTDACSRPITRKADAGEMLRLIISTWLIVLMAPRHRDLDEKGKASPPAGNTTAMMVEHGGFAELTRTVDEWYDVSDIMKRNEITDLRSQCSNIGPDRPKGAYMVD